MVKFYSLEQNSNSMKSFLLLLTLCFTLYAQEPKLELGFGVGVLHYPNYIGSKSYNSLLVPLPYIRYRGDYFKIDEDGLNGELFGIDGLKIDLSVSASLPADSDDDNARSDMPDLDLTGEIGFKFVYKIFEKDPLVLELEMPLRAVLSTDFTAISYRGVVSNPQLKLSLNYTEFEWTFRTGIVFANKDYNSYYYGVNAEYQTPTRAMYVAKSGFNGYKNRVGVTYKKGFWWAGAFTSYYNISDAVSKDSPLVETKSNLYLGASVAYIFYTQD